MSDSTDQSQSFKEVLTKIGGYLLIVPGALAAVAQFRDDAEKLGPTVIAVVIFFLALCWCVYVWLARVPAQIAPERLVRRFSQRSRWL